MDGDFWLMSRDGFSIMLHMNSGWLLHQEDKTLDVQLWVISTMLLVCMTSPSYQAMLFQEAGDGGAAPLAISMAGAKSVVLLKAVFRDFKERYRTHTQVIHIYIYI